MKTCSVEDCNKPKKSKGMCEMHYYRVRRNGALYYKKPTSKKVEINVKENGCIECTSHHKLSTGYYLLMLNHKRKSLHRHVYEEMFGEIPNGLVVRHKCDNRGCINPEHLELGTHQDNMKDMVDRGGSCKGSKNTNALITEEDVKEIRRLAFMGFKRKDICEMYGLKNANTITSIKYGHSWGHVK
jgi:hypothetical protein